MITWHFPALIGGRWTRAKITCNHGNKYQALEDFKAQQAAIGVVVQGHDMGQAWSQWA